MSRPDGRIEPGQPLRGAISARAWNRAQDAADLVLGAYAGTEGGTPVPPAPSSYTESLLQNNLGTDLEAYRGVPCSGFVGSDSAASSPGETALLPRIGRLVLNGSALSGVLDVDQPWCVTLEPIKSGAIGRVAVSGLVPFLMPGGATAGNYISRQGEARHVGDAQVVFNTNGLFGLINLGKSNYTFTIQTDRAWQRYTQWSTLYGISAANTLYDIKAGEVVVISKVFNSGLGKMQWSLISGRPLALPN